MQGLAQASLTRMLPGLATVPAWDGCDHIGPAYEGDLLEFRHRLVESAPAGIGRLMRFEITGTKLVGDGAATDILRWTPIVWAPLRRDADQVSPSLSHTAEYTGPAASARHSGP